MMATGKKELAALLEQHNIKPYDYDTRTGIKGIDKVRVEYVTTPRGYSFNHVGLVVRVQVEPYSRDGGRYKAEEALKAIPGVRVHGYSYSEKTKKGSGYWSPSKGGQRVHAAVERETHSFWVSLEQQARQQASEEDGES